MNIDNLVAYIQENRNFSDTEVAVAWERMDRWRCPLQVAHSGLYDNILDLVEEWCSENGYDYDEVFSEIDVEKILEAIDK